MFFATSNHHEIRLRAVACTASMVLTTLVCCADQGPVATNDRDTTSAIAEDLHTSTDVDTDLDAERGPDQADSGAADTASDIVNSADQPDANLDLDTVHETDLGPSLPTSVTENRDRLLAEYGQRLGSDRCRVWNDLDEVQRGVFLTITDLLGNRSWMTNDQDGTERTGATLETALDHVESIWAIRGAQEEGCFLDRCCGGGEFNRIFLSVDETLIAAFRDTDGWLPEWGPTTDLAGPHDPFTQSSETHNGQPRGQAHFFTGNEDVVTLDRPGVEGVSDPHVIEIDIDYNLIHDSNPECDYLRGRGSEVYADVWSRLGTGEPVDFAYIPSGCE